MSEEHEMPLLPSQPCEGEPALLDDARARLAAAEERAADSGGLLRRLVVSFVLLAAVAVVCFVVLPSRGIYVPPMIPLLGFVVIVVGTVLGSGEPVVKRKAKRAADDGRALGCCGPRPLRAFSDDDECCKGR
ncbi:MAG: hypothetical protein KF757_02870 [Phycisphaeraceae bacterium]|nr:hypothetical protein [Phycisphaeraceae bacterium]MCW5762124.1 hypothetical protein [Phycisphaeraceae bacterium]